MENTYLVLGIVLVFTGIIGYGYTIAETDECGSFLGEIDQNLDEETQQYCNRMKIANYGSTGLILAGLVLSIAGLIELSKNNKIPKD